jgi:DNA-binding transcriptional LysR family regulator
MKLHHLRTFVAIVAHGGVARAAAQLNLTQSAASRQISTLEADLGVPLFDRIGRRVLLSSAGEDLLRRSQRLLEDAEALGERARALTSGETGLLRFGATPQVIESLLADCLARYRKRHPGVEVHLIADGGAHLPQRLERGDVHLAIMPAGDERFDSRLLFPMHLLAVIPKAHPMARRTALEIADLADEPLLVMSPGAASVSWFESACHVAHITPRVLLQSAAPHTLIELAKSGYGLAIIPSSVRVHKTGVSAIPLVQRGAAIGRWATVAWDARRFLAPYAEQLVTEIVSSARRDYPGRSFTRRAPTLPKPNKP